MNNPFGDAQPASQDDLFLNFNNGSPSAGQDGLYLGRHTNSRLDGPGERIVYTGERHYLLFGPNGSGKMTRFLAPNLLGKNLLGRSIIAIDPKGQLAMITAKHQHQMGQKVKLLDPFGVVADIVAKNPEKYEYLIKHNLVESAGFNPLIGLNPDTDDFFDDAAGIAEALIKIDNNHQPHFPESAKGLTQALIMWEKQQQRERANVSNVRFALTEADFAGEWDEQSSTWIKEPTGLMYRASQMVEGGGDIIASLAGRFMNTNDEIRGVQSSADTQTRWMLSPPVSRDMNRRKGIDFAKLKDEPTTVYVILPAQQLRTHSVWLRLVIVTALRALYRPGGLRTLFLIDELAALGHLAPLEDAMGLVRDYRVQIAAITQDLSQLKSLYKDRWETFIANAGVVMGFAPNDLTTAKWMSERAGQMTIETFSRSEPQGHGVGRDESISTKQERRPLFLPQEIIGLSEGRGLLWLSGTSNPVTFFAPNYWKISGANSRALDNPYFISQVA